MRDGGQYSPRRVLRPPVISEGPPSWQQKPAAGARGGCLADNMAPGASCVRRRGQRRATILAAEVCRRGSRWLPGGQYGPRRVLCPPPGAVKVCLADISSRGRLYIRLADRIRRTNAPPIFTLRPLPATEFMPMELKNNRVWRTFGSLPLFLSAKITFWPSGFKPTTARGGCPVDNMAPGASCVRQ